MTSNELQEEFEGIDFPSTFAPRFNIAPSQPVMAICNDGKHAADFLLWGLIPSWAKDPIDWCAADQRPRRDACGETGISRRIQVQTLPHSGRRVLRVEEPARHKGQGAAFHPTHDGEAVCIRRVVG